MCLICQRIELIKKGENPYFVKELEAGYLVIGDHQYFASYSLFLAKEHVTELHHFRKGHKTPFSRRNEFSPRGSCQGLYC
ncbi:hypothetical protein TKY123642_05700 [Streptococcus pneumoniae]|nr:hypothetical protein TKY123642_05700 [Streptococcus pneumoniae]